MYAKLKITGNIEVLTGLHIGGYAAFSAIGAVDLEVIKDPASGLPLLPGSSLKGKMRSLLARALNEEVAATPDNDHPQIVRLFGSGSQGEKSVPGKVIFSDAVLDPASISDAELGLGTEIKAENTINRLTAVANPRQIERVMRGARFPLELIYEILNRPEDSETAVLQDFLILGKGLRLIECDYLGGSGTRGYGRVKFNDLKVQAAFGEVDDTLLELCLQSLQQSAGAA